jgi:hypothetical protein
MNKEKAAQLLESARADHETWEYCEELNHVGELYWWQIVNPPSSRLDVVCSTESGPVAPRGYLLAAAPELARWGIELAEEVERLQAGEVGRLQAELAAVREANADLRAKVLGMELNIAKAAG